MLEEELGKTSSNNDKPSNNDGEEQFDNELEEDDAFYDRVWDSVLVKRLSSTAPSCSPLAIVQSGAIQQSPICNSSLVEEKTMLN
jgi:hypothetical protein